MTISIPRTTSSSSGRSPQFLSPSVSALAIYDGLMLVYVANIFLDSTPQFATVYAKPASPTTVAFGSCTFTSSRATCTLTITTTTGQHAFDVIAYPVSQGTQPTASLRSPQDTGTPPTFTGVISSEGELSVNLSPGANPAQTLTLLGVASEVIFAGPASGTFMTPSTFGYRIADSSGGQGIQIVQPGNAYDNGPVTITGTPSGMVTISPNSIATPPASVGDQFFDVTCVNGSGGPVTINFNAGTMPNTMYASKLTYSPSNYAGATIRSIPFSCDPASATIPITVQGRRR